MQIRTRSYAKKPPLSHVEVPKNHVRGLQQVATALLAWAGSPSGHNGQGQAKETLTHEIWRRCLMKFSQLEDEVCDVCTAPGSVGKTLCCVNGSGRAGVSSNGRQSRSPKISQECPGVHRTY